MTKSSTYTPVNIDATLTGILIGLANTMDLASKEMFLDYQKAITAMEDYNFSKLMDELYDSFYTDELVKLFKHSSYKQTIGELLLIVSGHISKTDAVQNTVNKTATLFDTIQTSINESFNPKTLNEHLTEMRAFNPFSHLAESIHFAMNGDERRATHRARLFMEQSIELKASLYGHTPENTAIRQIDFSKVCYRALISDK